MYNSFRHGQWVKFLPTLPAFAAPYLDGAHRAPDGMTVGIFQVASADHDDHIAVCAPDGRNHTIERVRQEATGAPIVERHNVRFPPQHSSVILAADPYMDIPEPRRLIA